MKKPLILAFFFLFATVSLAQPGRPKFVIFPTNSMQYGTLTVGDSIEKSFRISVDTSSPNDVAVTLSTLNTNAFHIVGSSSFTVVRGTSDTVRIRFKPLAGQLYRDTVYVTHNGDTTFSKNPTRITMSGTGVQPDTFAHISVNPTNVNFNPILVGGTSTRTVVITNTSFIEKQLSVAVPDADAPFSIVSGGGSFSIGQNQTDSLKIKFTPTSAGTFRDTLLVATNADSTGNKIVKIIIAGQAVAPDTLPRMSVIPGQPFLSIGSATVGKTIQQSIKITNSSDSSIKIALTGNCTIANGKNFAIVGSGSFTVARRDTATITVSFTPDTVKTFIDTLVISNNSSTPTTKIIIFGQGVAASKFPKIVLGGLTNGGGGGGGNTSRLVFGNVKTDSTAKKSFTITNASDSARVLIGAVSATKHSQFIISNNSGAFSLDSGKTRSVEISFLPGAVANFLDTIFVTSNDSTTPSLRIIISGSGVDSVATPKPKFTIDKPNINFGTVGVGTSATQQVFTITNTGGASSSLNVNISTPHTPFTLTSGQTSFTLAAGQSRRDTVIFEASTAGSFSDSIIISTNADQSSRVVVRIVGVVSSSGSVAQTKILENDVTINPNPVSTKTRLHFSLSEASPITITLYSSNGNQALHLAPQPYFAGANTIDLDCSTLSAGLYYLQLQLSDGARIVPVVIRK